MKLYKDRLRFFINIQLKWILDVNVLGTFYYELLQNSSK